MPKSIRFRVSGCPGGPDQNFKNGSCSTVEIANPSSSSQLKTANCQLSYVIDCRQYIWKFRDKVNFYIMLFFVFSLTFVFEEEKIDEYTTKYLYIICNNIYNTFTFFLRGDSQVDFCNFQRHMTLMGGLSSVTSKLFFPKH